MTAAPVETTIGLYPRPAPSSSGDPGKVGGVTNRYMNGGCNETLRPWGRMSRNGTPSQEGIQKLDTFDQGCPETGRPPIPWNRLLAWAPANASAFCRPPPCPCRGRGSSHDNFVKRAHGDFTINLSKTSPAVFRSFAKNLPGSRWKGVAFHDAPR